MPTAFARTTWLQSAFDRSLSRDVVHVLRFSTDRDAADLVTLLDDQECRRSDQFAFDADRRRFIVAHAVTRLVLGQCLHVSPASLRFNVGAHGKPTLRGGNVELRFNLSHAGTRALLAIGVGREVGVDIERARPVEVLAVARRYFADDEYRALVLRPEEERVRAFYRCWTRKESFLKARGDGLSAPLDGFVVSVDEAAPQLLLASADAGESAWTIVDVPVDAGYAGAVTARGAGWRLACWDAPGP